MEQSKQSRELDPFLLGGDVRLDFSASVNRKAACLESFSVCRSWRRFGSAHSALPSPRLAGGAEVTVCCPRLDSANCEHENVLNILSEF